MTKTLAALTAALILALMATPAEAKRKRYKAPRQHVAMTTHQSPGCSAEYNHLAWCSSGYGIAPPLIRRPPKRLPDPPQIRTARKRPAAPVAAVASTGLVERARQYLGQTASQIGLHRTTLWCAAFMNYVTGGGTGSDLAKSWLAKPRTGLQVGAVAVMGRGRRGGHVGIVSGIDSSGNPIIISGNHGRRVRETVYPSSRIIAYVQPS